MTGNLVILDTDGCWTSNALHKINVTISLHQNQNRVSWPCKEHGWWEVGSARTLKYWKYYPNPLCILLTMTLIHKMSKAVACMQRNIYICTEILYPLLYSWEMRIETVHMCQETFRHLAGWIHLSFWTNTSTYLELVTQNIIITRILWSSSSFWFLEQSVVISSLITVARFLIEISTRNSTWCIQFYSCGCPPTPTVNTPKW